MSRAETERAERADVLADVLRCLLTRDVPLGNAKSAVAAVDAVLTQALADSERAAQEQASKATDGYSSTGYPTEV